MIKAFKKGVQSNGRTPWNLEAETIHEIKLDALKSIEHNLGILCQVTFIFNFSFLVHSLQMA